MALSGPRRSAAPRRFRGLSDPWCDAAPLTGENPMREREELRSATIRNVVMFLDHSASRDPRLARWHAKFVETERRLARLTQDERHALQFKGDDAAQPKHAAARLRERFLLRISGAGRKLLRNVAGAERALRVPAKRANPAAIAEAARRLGDFLKPKARRLFLDAGFEPEFWSAFDEARTALALAIKDAAAEQGKAAKLAGRVRALIREGRADIEVLGGVLEPLLAADSTMRHMWDRARRVPRAIGRPTDAKLRRRAAREAGKGEATA